MSTQLMTVPSVVDEKRAKRIATLDRMWEAQRRANLNYDRKQRAKALGISYEAYLAGIEAGLYRRGRPRKTPAEEKA